MLGASDLKQLTIFATTIDDVNLIRIDDVNLLRVLPKMSLFYGASFKPPKKKSANGLDWDQPTLTQMLSPDPPVPRTLTLDGSSSSAPSSSVPISDRPSRTSFTPSSVASATARLARAQWGGRSVTDAITLEESSSGAGSSGVCDDEDVSGHVPSSSEKRRRIAADNYRRSSDRVEARDRAAAEADEARNREDMAAWEASRVRDARSAKLSMPDSDDDVEASLLRDPFSAYSVASRAAPYTSTQGAVCSERPVDRDAGSIASVLVPGVASLPSAVPARSTVAQYAAVVVTPSPVAPSSDAVVSPSRITGGRPSHRRKCVKPPVCEESSSKSGGGGEEKEEEATVAPAPKPQPQVLPCPGTVRASLGDASEVGVSSSSFKVATQLEGAAVRAQSGCGHQRREVIARIAELKEKGGGREAG